MQSVAINKIDLSVLRHGRNLVAILGPRREVRKNLVEGGMSESGTKIAATTDERNVDAQVGLGPLYQVVIEVDGCVRKSCEDENFLVFVTKLVVGGVQNLGGDELASVRRVLRPVSTVIF